MPANNAALTKSKSMPKISFCSDFDLKKNAALLIHAD